MRRRPASRCPQRSGSPGWSSAPTGSLARPPPGPATRRCSWSPPRRGGATESAPIEWWRGWSSSSARTTARRRRRAAARDPLRRALDLAERGGMLRLAQRARSELRACGARPRRSAVTGLESLTPSEPESNTLVFTFFAWLVTYCWDLIGGNPGRRAARCRARGIRREDGGVHGQRRWGALQQRPPDQRADRRLSPSRI